MSSPDELQAQIHHRIVEQLSPAERRYQDLVLNLRVVVLEMDSLGVVTFLNPAWTEQLGYPIGESVGKMLAEFVSRAAREELAEILTSKDCDADRPREIPFLHSDGHEVWFELSIRDSGGQLRFGVLHNVDERRAAEQRLRASTAEARSLALVARGTHNVVIITDALGLAIWVNEAFTRLTGFQPEEIIGRKPGSLMQGPDTDPNTVGFMRQMIRAGKGFQTEIQNYRKDRSKYWLSIEVQPIHDEQGRLIRFIAIEHDITERRSDEERLREQTSRLAEQHELAALHAEVGMALNRDAPLKDLLHGCCDAILRHIGASFVRVWVLHDSDQILELQASVGLYTHVNGSHARIKVGEFKIGQIAKCRTPMLTNQVVGDPQVHDQEWARREGIVSFAGYPLLIADRVVGVLGLFSRYSLSKDTIEAIKVAADAIALGVVRKQAEEALRESEARQRAVIESALDCIIIIDRHGKVIEFNPAAERTFGFVRSEMLGRELSGQLIPPIHRESHLKGIERYLRTGKSEILRKRLKGLPALRKDGSEFVVELSIVPMELDGEPVFAAFLRDITELKIAEEKQAEAASQMRKAKEEAEAANRSKSQFLANMSHEVRTPMAAVLGYADIILDPKLDPARQAEYVRAIRRNGEHLLRLINDILDLSKIEAGQLKIEHVPCRLWQMVTDAFSVTEIRAQEKRIRLRVVPSGRLPRKFTTDPVRFSQILFNLLDNAVKFTDPGRSVELRLRMEQTTAGANLILEIEDEGRGMSTDEIGRLFRPFVQADASMTRRYGGTGLGLSICKRLAEEFKGSITVRSEPGAGSCFTVVLPADPADMVHLVDAEELATSSNVRPQPIARTRRLTGRVLLAEDNPDNRQIIRYFLEHAGLEVETVENGREAIEWAMAHNPEIVLMDMQMPELDGYAATTVLRERGYERPIIAITAHAMAGDEEKCLRVGCDAYLTKPVQPEELIAVLAKHLPRRTGRPQFAETDSAPYLELPPEHSTASVGKDPIEQLYAEFRRALPNRIQSLETAIAEGNLTSLTNLAHQLKGAAGMYEMPEISETAGLLEQACREGQDENLLADLMRELKESAARHASKSDKP